MKQYLNDFMTECGYEPQDIAFLCDAYEAVIQNAEAKALLEQSIAAYEENYHCDYDAILEAGTQMGDLCGIHPYTTRFLIYLCLTRRLRTLYRDHGIDDEIFWNSMQDLRYKLEECKAVKGVCGSFVCFWFPGFFNLTRFALGRLQFEIIRFGHTYEKNGHKLTPESRVLNVHIPRTGTPMTPAALQDSFAQARAFFRRELGEHPAVVCHSWLLWPEHEKILKPTSNTVYFLKLFDIFNEGYCENDDNLWRLFDTDERHPDRLPADSSARRAYIELLRQGKRTGWGHGVLFL